MDVLTEAELNQAFERVKPEFAQLRSSALIPLNVDPLTAATTIRTALPRIRELRPALERALNDFNFSNVDNLNTYALALIFANSRLTCTKLPPERLVVLAAEATKLRTQLLSDVTVLARWGFIKGVKPECLSRTTSYRSLAGDILSLSTLLKNDWEAIGSRCGVSQAKLERATGLADELLQAAGQRARTPLLVADATLDRQKVFTLCVRAYNQVRKAVTYVRRDHADEDDFVPPLGGKRRRARKQPLASIKVDSMSNLAIEAMNGEAPAAVEPDVLKTTVGLPGVDPFLK